MGFDPYSYKKEYTYDENYNKQLEKEKKNVREIYTYRFCNKTTRKSRITRRRL